MANIFVGITEPASQYVPVQSTLHEHEYLDIAVGEDASSSLTSVNTSNKFWVIKPLDAEIRVSFDASEPAGEFVGWPVAAGEWFYAELHSGKAPNIYVVG